VPVQRRQQVAQQPERATSTCGTSALTYKNGPFFIGGTYMALDGDDYFNPLSLPLGPLGTAISGAWPSAITPVPSPSLSNYEDGDLNTLNIGKTQNYYVTGQYTFGNNVIRAALWFSRPDDKSVAYYIGGVRTVDLHAGRRINNLCLGYQYNFSKRTRVWAEYNSGQDSDPIWSATQARLHRYPGGFLISNAADRRK
jgi:predicted porin